MAIHPAAATQEQAHPAPGDRAQLPVVGDTLVIHTQAQLLELLARCRDPWHALPAHKLHFRIDDINAGVAGRSEARLNAMLHACGCPAGNVAGSVGLLGYALGLFVAREVPLASAWVHLCSGLALCLVANLLGRAVHHLRTRRKLVRELRLLIAQTRIG